MHTHCTRRRFLQLGGTLLAGSALAGPLMLSPEDGWSAEDKIEWSNIFAKAPMGGFGTVKELGGAAFANQRSLSVGARVESGEQLRVTRSGGMVISVGDRTIFRLRGGTVLDFNANPERQGVLNLVVGSILAVLPKGNRYLLGGPVATIGIKGTVVYRQVFEENVRTARAMEGRTATLPASRDYFCTCNGAVDFLNNRDRAAIGSDSATHHSSGFLSATEGKMFSKFEMINHFDRDIKALIDVQDGEKHDSSFLQL